jgi:hypothetical protein
LGWLCLGEFCVKSDAESAREQWLLPLKKRPLSRERNCLQRVFLLWYVGGPWDPSLKESLLRLRRRQSTPFFQNGDIPTFQFPEKSTKKGWRIRDFLILVDKRAFLGLHLGRSELNERVLFQAWVFHSFVSFGPTKST